MIDMGYFTEGMGREPGEETVPEPHPDEAVVFEEFFTIGLRMPHTLCLLIFCWNFKYRYIRSPPMPFIVKIYLGSFELQGSLVGWRLHEKIRASLSTEEDRNWRGRVIAAVWLP
jgi:hypothetical protein